MAVGDRLACRTPAATAAHRAPPRTGRRRSRRPGAELSAWAAVHGLSMLLATGPLRDLEESLAHHAVAHLLDVMGRGLIGPVG